MRLKYRPDIDGLRAIAVLSVVLYHAKFSILGINFLQGGFLGVDIFFVISGYLITKQILLEIKSTKKFSFHEFYIRRIKRIIPALFFITLTILVIGNIILLPIPLEQFAESIIYQFLNPLIDRGGWSEDRGEKERELPTITFIRKGDKCKICFMSGNHGLIF